VLNVKRLPSTVLESVHLIDGHIQRNVVKSMESHVSVLNVCELLEDGGLRERKRDSNTVLENNSDGKDQTNEVQELS